MFANKDWVSCPSRQIYDSLVSYADLFNVPMHEGEMTYQHTYECIGFENGKLRRFIRTPLYGTQISIDTFLKNCENWVNRPIIKQFTSTGYDLELTKHHIIVGCQTITWEKYNELLDLVKRTNISQLR